MEAIVKLEKPDGAGGAVWWTDCDQTDREPDEDGRAYLGVPRREDVDAAEDRELFDKILEDRDPPAAKRYCIYTAEEAKAVATDWAIPYWCVLSYVLGGQGMQIAISDEEIEEFMEIINRIAQGSPDPGR